MDNDRMQRWAAHCRRMAEATYAIADWCEDPEMMGAYVALGAKWIQIGDMGPPSQGDEPMARRADDGATRVRPDAASLP